jgi:glycosyltransferase involved in cell wall biosynthesis
MAAAVPVVVTRTCPWPQIEAQGCGRWVPQDAEALANAALEILADLRAAEAMGQQGRRLIHENYTWDSIGGRMLAEYERHLKTFKI